MSNLSRFAAYAAAFEKSYESDDWLGLRPFFAERAVYITGIETGRIEGRDAVLDYFREDLDGFDRCIDTRKFDFIEAPVEEGATVRFRCRVTYRATGVPDLLLVLDEFVTFAAGLIVQLEDRYDDETRENVAAYVEEHRGKLGFASD